MIDRTRTAIDEDFSLEEQNFMSVIDMETEDDYSRGNVPLYIASLNMDTGSGGTNIPPPVPLLSVGNYFIEAIIVSVAYCYTHVGGISGTQQQLNINDNLSNLYFSNTYATPGTAPGSLYAYNSPLVIDTEIILPRGVSLTLNGNFNPFTGLVFSINIYGRQLP